MSTDLELQSEELAGVRAENVSLKEKLREKDRNIEELKVQLAEERQRVAKITEDKESLLEQRKQQLKCATCGQVKKEPAFKGDRSGVKSDSKTVKSLKRQTSRATGQASKFDDSSKNGNIRDSGPKASFEAKNEYIWELWINELRAQDNNRVGEDREAGKTSNRVRGRT